jgi:hypothetical protein
MRLLAAAEGHDSKGSICEEREGNEMAIATAEPSTIIDGRHARPVKTVGRVFGWFFLATFLTSIPAYFIGYGPVESQA